MKRRTQRISVIAGLLFLFGLLVSTASAEAPITMSLLTSKTSYLPGEAIHMQIDVLNDSGQDVIAQEGFSQLDFYLKITFTDPDGKPIFTKYQDVTYEGGPPYRSQGKDAAIVETILAGVKIPQVLDDARTFYDFLKPGWYSAQVFAHLETYSQSAEDPATGKQIAFLEDQDTAGTIASNRVSFEIASPVTVVNSSIDVKVNLLEIGTGTKPGAKKSPIVNAPVRLYTRSLVSEYEPVNWKVYANIWNDTAITYHTSFTDSQGLAAFGNISQDNYIVMTTSHGVMVGSPVPSDDPDWEMVQPIEKHLMVMKKANKKVNPGKTTKKKGSLLLITEPEYVEWDIEWDTEQELYPFVFETIDEWGVTTSVSPPEGFVADHDALSAEVIDEMEAVQFTITDAGSKWEETKVKYKIKHKGKSENVTSEIGIKLSDKLAKKLGKSKYGDAACPGVFEDGKKISDECEADDKDKDKDTDKDKD